MNLTAATRTKIGLGQVWHVYIPPVCEVSPGLLGRSKFEKYFSATRKRFTPGEGKQFGRGEADVFRQTLDMVG
jgi:hypothetical protein